MKKGVSLVSLIIVIVVMGILAGIVVFSGLDSNESIILDMFALELLDVQNGVDEYFYRYNKYPSGNDYILDTTTIKTISQFEEETIIDNKINFKLVDLTLIGMSSTEFGKGEGKDVYVLSETTGIVYYLQGVTAENKTHYTLTDELYDITNANNSDLVSTQDIKVYNVIFTPNTTEYTNKPVTVTIKIPKIAVVNSVVTTNNKSVSQETVQGLYKQIQINKTSSDKTGNYKITVNYTYRGTQKTSEYEVTNYDANLPTVTYTETTNGDLKTVNVTINSNNSKIKTVKYEQEIVYQITYFENYGKKITNNIFVVDKDAYFTIYVETEAGTKLMVNNMPEAWTKNVIDIVDGVPIPKGFAASPYSGENKKDDGLVIYQLDEDETSIPTTETQFDSLTKRNQYVWVPVEDFSKFVRINFDESEVISNSLGDNLWEVVIDMATNIPLANQDAKYMSSGTIEEVQAMYQSVKEYKGFYIARYEAGLDENRTTNTTLVKGSKVYSMMGKIPYTYIYWSGSSAANDDANGAVEVSRSIYPKENTNYGVVSTLIYGVQWDRTLAWWLEVGAKDGKGNTVTSVKDSINYGNSGDHVIGTGDLNTGAKYAVFNVTSLGSYRQAGTNPNKPSGTTWMLTTGALKAAKVNNIYDMAGNIAEWTMEVDSTYNHVSRGGDCGSSGSTCSVSYRSKNSSYSGGTFTGFRYSLYIKK